MARKGKLPAPLRARLLALGIPEAQHTAEGLAGVFPEDFNIRTAALDAQDLAQVLIYLSKRGVIGVPRTAAGTSLKKIEPGWHFCRFYRSVQELLDMIGPYVADGLRNHEGCLWVVPAAVTKDAACDAVARSIPDVGGYLASGQLEILPHPNWYLDASGRLKSFEEIAGALLAKQDRALAKGFKFLRAAGDTGWVSGAEQSKDFIDYEMKVNAALRSTKVAAVCTYQVDVTADEVVSIVSAHQDALSSLCLPISA